MIKYIFSPFFKLNVCVSVIEVIVSLYVSFYKNQSIVIDFLIGTSLWQITEYTYHRFLQHGIMYFTHEKHHIYPTKLKYIHLSFILTQGFVPLIVHMCYNRLSIFSGFLTNGIIFEFCHQYSHHVLDTKFKQQFLNAKIYHKIHHQYNTKNFGFLSPSYDYLFNTIDSQIDKSSAYNKIIFFIGMFIPVLLFNVKLTYVNKPGHFNSETGSNSQIPSHRIHSTYQ